MGYGNMLRQKRVEKEMTLRELSLRTDIDVAYLSRVERENIQPPQDEELLDSINVSLSLGADEAQKMKDQSAIDNRRMPKELADQAQKIDGFPLFLRTVSNKKLTNEKLKELTNFINERY
jgi:transcriptional regulator with XRE-family HTH domain